MTVFMHASKRDEPQFLTIPEALTACILGCLPVKPHDKISIRFDYGIRNTINKGDAKNAMLMVKEYVNTWAGSKEAAALWFHALVNDPVIAKVTSDVGKKMI